MNDTILLTGATGHIGSNLLHRLLDDPDAQVVALVRAHDDSHLNARRRALVAALGTDPGARLGVVRGDVALPLLGLSSADHARVVGEVDSVVHGAASVRFDLPDDEASARNVESTRHVLALAQVLLDGGRLRRLDHISTAYVAGDRIGTCFEDECDVGQGFRNSYEASKCQSEELVREAMAQGLPACIHRPSIVVGDSRSGGTDSFNVLYWPLKLYARGWWRTVPGSEDTLCDIVPVDFVAQAIATLHRDPASIGATVHLAAGPAAPRAGDLAVAIAQHVGGPPIRFVDQARYRRYLRPLLWPLFQTRRGEAIRRGGDAFMPYFLQNPLFDTEVACALLPADLRPPLVADYLGKIVRYAVNADFGGR